MTKMTADNFIGRFWKKLNEYNESESKMAFFRLNGYYYDLFDVKVCNASIFEFYAHRPMFQEDNKQFVCRLKKEIKYDLCERIRGREYEQARFYADYEIQDDDDVDVIVVDKHTCDQISEYYSAIQPLYYRISCSVNSHTVDEYRRENGFLEILNVLKNGFAFNPDNRIYERGYFETEGNRIDFRFQISERNGLCRGSIKYGFMEQPPSIEEF